MSNRITPEEFRKTADRCFSDVKSDPCLAYHIIAAEKGETKLKKKTSVSLVPVLVVLVLLATVAYAATEIYRQVTWKGEPLGTTEAPFTSETIYAEDPVEDEMINHIENLTATVPEDDYSEVWYTENGSRTINVHKKQKTFSSYEDFQQFMSGIDYLTVPVWFPENMNHFSGKVLMESKVNIESEEDGYFVDTDGVSVFQTGNIDGYYKQTEEWDDGPIHFRRYTLNDAEAVITGYELIIGFTDHSDIIITSELYTGSGSSFTLTADETAKTIDVKNMNDALLINSSNNTMHDRLFLRRELYTPITFVSLMQGQLTSTEEVLTIMTYDYEPETLVKIITGE